MNKLLKKILVLLVTVFSATSCGVNGSGRPSSDETPTTSEVGENNSSSNTEEESTECTNGACGGTELDLDAINDYLATNDHWTDMNANGNKVALIPFTHINGPKAEWNFFALVNFEYNARTYYKYQVTYLSCTCRSADVNYWQTAYVELTVPKSGNVDDVKLKRLSFDYDGTGDYLAGFWGDSGVGHAIPGSLNDVTYEDIKTSFIPFLVGKTYKEISSYDGYELGSSVYDDTVFGINPDDFAKDMEGVQFHGEQVKLDHFNGASVSTNNILRMLVPLMEYHAANNI